MINLLPPDLQESYRFARRNTVLARWAWRLGFALIGLVILSAGGIFVLQRTANNYTQQANLAQAALDGQDQAATEKQVTEISSNIKLVVQVLSKQVLFSKLLQQIATIIPDNATLSNIVILQSQTALDITANTKDYNAATQLQVNLADPANKIFSKADIVSITCTEAGEAGTVASKYPCKVTIRALFNPSNPFLFIGDQKAAKS